MRSALKKAHHYRKRLDRSLATLKRKSFTLIELLIVIAILGILAAAVLVAINPGKRMKQATDSKRKNDLSQLVNALNSYLATKGQYPGTGLIGSDQQCWINSTPGNPPVDCNTTNFLYSLISNGDIKKLPYDPGKNGYIGGGGSIFSPTCGNAQLYLYNSPSPDSFILMGVLEAEGSENCQPSCVAEISGYYWAFHFCYNSSVGKFIGI